MQISFAPLTSFQYVALAACILEVKALATGFALFDDLDIDQDTLLEEVAGNPEDFGLELEADYLREEEFGAKALVLDRFRNRVGSELERRARGLGPAYWFILGDDGAVTIELKPLAQRSAIGLAAMWMSLFDLIEATDICQSSREDLRWFRDEFESVFEVVSALSLSAMVEGASWWSGRSRGHQRFLMQLNSLAQFLQSGNVKVAEELEANQIGVNDGGIDAIAVSTADGRVRPDAQILLLGATIQRGNRRHKMIGVDQINRFRNFFNRRPFAACSGIMSIPYDGSEAEQQDCRDRNCVFMPRQVIEENLGSVGRRPLSVNLRRFYDQIVLDLVDCSRGILEDIELIVGAERRTLAGI